MAVALGEHEPLVRWSPCSLDLADDKISGFRDGESSARRKWGAVPG